MRLICALFKLSLTLCIFANVAIAEPTNLGIIKQQLRAYHNSGAYAKEQQKVIDAAKAVLVENIAINNQAKHRKKLAMVLDIDDTSLSNYTQLKQLDFSNNFVKIKHAQQLAYAPAINPTLNLYNYAKHHSIAVFFITGRARNQRAHTVKNLHQAGYNNWNGLYFKPAKYQHKSASIYKTNIRKMLTAKGYTIVLNIGDQHSDLKGGYAENSFKLPNPYYYIG